MNFLVNKLYFKFSIFIWSILFGVFLPLFLIFSIAFKNKLKHRKIFDLDQNAGQYKRELIISIRTFVIYQLALTLIWFLYHAKLTFLYTEYDKFGLFYLLVAFLVIHVAHDGYFYFTHKLMHEHPSFIKWHRTHHSARVPTPLSGNLFSIQEACVQAMYFILIAVFIPMPVHLLMFFFFFMNWINAWGHMEFEFWPNALYRLPYAYTFNSITHHNYHHFNAKGNYGLYHRNWDESFSTLNPDTYNHFYKTREKIHLHQKRTYIPFNSRADRQDIVGQFFEECYDQGENVEIFYEMDGESLPLYHTFTDGIGGLISNLNKKNISLIRAPKIRHQEYTVSDKFQVLLISLGSFIRFKTQWIDQSIMPVENGEKLFKSFLNAEELNFVLAKAKSSGVSLNTLFLHEFHTILKDKVNSPKDFTWVIPVSMRKKIDATIDLRNDVWFCDVSIKDRNALDLHKTLTHLYGDVDVFGGLILKLLDHPLRYFFFPIIYLQKLAGHNRNATFSNLGAYEGSQDLDIYFAPPALQSAPFAIGCVTYNQKCYFTLRVHPSLFKLDLENIFESFKRNLLS